MPIAADCGSRVDHSDPAAESGANGTGDAGDGAGSGLAVEIVELRTDRGLETAKVAVVTPFYGDLAPGWGAGHYGGARIGRGVDVTNRFRSCQSLLPTAFNECLAEVLNMREQGHATHIAMQHSDISPKGRWLEDLYGDMYFAGAMLISTVVPIKNESGHTSTAIGIRGDRWKVPRVVTMDQRASLPVTFGPEHVCQDGEVLLINTGLWMSDIRHPFWDWFVSKGGAETTAFNLYSKIYRDAEGVFRVATRSEDWELSHDLDAFGCRYLATWRPKLTHRGPKEWPNY